MRNLAKTFVVFAACLAVSDAASAMNMASPFVSVSFQGAPAKLGTVWGPAPRSFQVQLWARVVANCPYHVAATFESFRHEKGKAVISAADLSVAVNGQEVPIEKGRVAVAHSPRPTSLAGEDVGLNLLVKVKGAERYPQGRYGGALVITVMPGS
ncbi:hypothetical protein [Anaerobaca lacustris]|uniref:Fimbrial protein n=1 Tax=Anaerobaca lacustris TaxID=3044600 RepID=A0AAW6TV29_9BACT|nr:hypothetical protein [Sedimentisphaerales bacterium M17dextr]